MAEDQDIRCPRCGYDQRGQLGLWEASCPLDGTCVECGLRFRWAELLRPEKFVPTWSVEYATGALGVVRAAARTMLRSARPIRFWSTMRMSQAVRGRRLALYVLFLLLLSLAAYALQQTVTAIQLRHQLARAPGIATVVHPYTSAVAEAVFLPFARSSRGTLAVPQLQARPMYPPPVQMHDTLHRLAIGRGLFSGRRQAIPELILICATELITITCVLLVLPLTFVLLPISRRRAKVRWAHLGRVGVYSLAIPGFGTALLGGGMLLAALFPQVMHLILWAMMWVLLIVLVPGLITWWTFAISRYLRLPHAFAVALLLAVLSLLLLTFSITALAALLQWMLRWLGL